MRSESLEAALRVVGMPDPDSPSALNVAKIRGLLVGYAKRWPETQTRYRIESVENVVAGPVWNLGSKKTSKTYRLAGKLDVRARDGREYVVIDHKSTGEDIDDPSAPYWRQQIVEGQWLTYMVLEWLNGRQVDYVLLDVVKRPASSPKEIRAKRDQTEVARTGFYFGRQLSPQSLAYVKDNGREDLEAYEARLAWDCSEARPNWYFQERKLARLDNELRFYLEELWQDAQEIRDERLKVLHTRNGKACLAYGTPCQFLGICSGHDNEGSDRWKKRENVHEELPGLENSRGYLTNSRIAMYKLCHKKHHLLYNLGIERQEPSESRDFGTLWHDCLGEYFLTMRKIQQGKEKGETEQDGRTGTGFTQTRTAQEDSHTFL